MKTAESIVEGIVQGSKSCETLLVDKYWQPLFYVINRKCNDPSLAQDITQDALLITIEKARAGAIHEPKALSAFVHKVAENALIAHYRKETRRKTEPDEHIQSHVNTYQQNIPDTIDTKQLVNIVKQVMDDMSVERDKQLLIAYFVHGKSKPLICESLDLSEAHFDRVLYRARNRLKQQLAIKLKVDFSSQQFATLLGAAFMAYVSTHGYIANYVQKNSNEVREPTHLQHLTHNDAQRAVTMGKQKGLRHD